MRRDRGQWSVLNVIFHHGTRTGQRGDFSCCHDNRRPCQLKLIQNEWRSSPIMYYSTVNGVDGQQKLHKQLYESTSELECGGVGHYSERTALQIKEMDGVTEELRTTINNSVHRSRAAK
ncbi:hypothetical protein MHYP_G00125250 [Metynnis hypsauchen]